MSQDSPGKFEMDYRKIAYFLHKAIGVTVSFFSLVFSTSRYFIKSFMKKMFHAFLLVIIGRISLHQRKKIMELVILAQITISSAIIEQRVKSTRKEVLHG